MKTTPARTVSGIERGGYPGTAGAIKPTMRDQELRAPGAAGWAQVRTETPRSATGKRTTRFMQRTRANLMPLPNARDKLRADPTKAEPKGEAVRKPLVSFIASLGRGAGISGRGRMHRDTCRVDLKCAAPTVRPQSVEVPAGVSDETCVVSAL